jgi:AcrR family transcriptional regulator
MSTRRGRPPGRTEQGVETEHRLYETALRLFGERGFHATTLRDIAAEAGVSPGLMYRYLPSKEAVVTRLYAELSARFAGAPLPDGAWWGRCWTAIDASIDQLSPHRDVLRAVIGPLLVDPEIGLLAPSSAQARAAVQGVFVRAVVGATPTVPHDRAAALGRIADAVQLAALVLWLVDRSPRQWATHRVLAVARSFGPAMRVGIRLPGACRTIVALDDALAAALSTDREGDAARS